MTDTTPPLIVAVSGGVDSVVMLDRLAKSKRPLVVAHVDHGIRADSGEDAAFAKQLAERYGLPFVSTTLKLGANASEDEARRARYAWLETVRESYQATAIATAHHQDDILETILINLHRGTGWRGLCSLRETPTRHRPLLGFGKVQVVTYAIEHNLEWREDSTNDDIRYLRNLLRHGAVARLDIAQRQALLALYETQCRLRDEIDSELARLLARYADERGIDRHVLIMGSDDVAVELLGAWLGIALERVRLRDLLYFAKTAQPGAKWSLDRTQFVVAKKDRLIVSAPRG